MVLYFDPVESPAPIKRVWCLFEILTLANTPGGELSLGGVASHKLPAMRHTLPFTIYELQVYKLPATSLKFTSYR